VVGALGTQLNATASVTTAPVNTSFTINGTLSATGPPIPSATIQLQNSTDDVTFTNVTVAPTTTDSNGNYSFSNNESVAGTYYYRATYAGYSSSYLNATSNVVSVNVTVQTTSNTKLTAVATPITVPYNTAQFTISGVLSNATSSAGITGATVTLENANTSTVINTTTTGASGTYTFSQSESVVGTYYFQTTYAGNALYNSTTSNVVNVAVTPIATSLNATANVSTTEINTPFTINGTLSENPSGAPIAGQNITLQVSTNTFATTLQGVENGGTWTNVTNTTTNSSGFYQFSLSEPVAGHYWYRTAYDGNVIESNAISVNVGVQVGTQTSLTAAANVTSTVVNTPFTISGKLSNATSGNGIYNQTITLQQNESGTWTTVANTATDTNGNYSFSPSEPAPGIYQFQTTYAGNGEFSNATSAVVNVNVSTTQLSIAVAPNTTEINTNFTINGTLSNATSVGIPNATIQLQSSTDNATFTNVTTSVTNASGFYTFNQSEPTLNIYYFRTTYAGNATLGSATSTVVSVLVNTVGTTQLTANATPGIVPVNVNFTISGTLNDTSGTPITGAAITLENYTNSTVIATTTTDSNGNYSFSHNEPTLGTYGYKTAYAGYLGINGTTSNEVNVTVTNVTTQLTAAANVTSVNVSVPFTISGTLSTTNGTTPGPIANATIIFTTSPGGATIATTTTNATGNYAFNQSEPTLGTYHYVTTYAGNTTDYYANATSSVVTVQVGPPTTLTATANVTTTGINTPFTINGTLSTTSGGISGQIITLQQNESGTWTNVNTTTTDSNGNYAFSLSESVSGTYQYQTTYAGTPSIFPATSNAVSVAVTSMPTPITPISSPAATGNFLFVTGSDNALWYKTWNGATWSSATSLGGVLTSSPAATSPGNGVIDVFVRGGAGALYEKTTTNGGTSWSNWISLGGQIPTGTGPAACSWGAGRVDLFVQGMDSALWHKSYTGTSWSSWQSLGGALTLSPGATSPSSGTIDVFVLGTDSGLWWKTTTNSGATWSGWTSVGGI
jgi:5-hydroxyisourate hydrolase-like protein (transthyretin family)